MILVIDKSRKNGNMISDIFKYMGIISRAETPEAALSEISLLYRAVLIVNPYLLANVDSYLQKLRVYSSGIPIFAISDKEILRKESFDMIFEYGSTSSNLYRKIAEFCKRTNRGEIGEYTLAGIDASASLGYVKYFSKIIPFTKTESMIIRVLIRAYPAPMKAKEILKYAFSQSKLPNIMVIRTHLSVINKKFRELTDKNLIVTDGTHGYLISTPNLINDRNLVLLP